MMVISSATDEHLFIMVTCMIIRLYYSITNSPQVFVAKVGDRSPLVRRLLAIVSHKTVQNISTC